MLSRFLMVVSRFLQYYLLQMCVDDYQFRHYTAKRQKICRRFVFRGQEGHQRAFNVNISQFERYGKLCLCEILLHLSKKGLNVKDYSFFMPQFDITIEAGDKCQVPFDMMTYKEILFQMHVLEKQVQHDNYESLYYTPAIFVDNPDIDESKYVPCQACMKERQSCELPQPTTHQQSELQSESMGQTEEMMSEEANSEKSQKEGLSIGYNIPAKESSISIEKKHKEQERTIQEAILKTKTWRMLHENCSFSLKNAAHMVQVSKKTLDDYFLVLRVGDYHGYNYKANLTKKIGHLRAFIRNQPVKVTGRLPKQVNCFSLVPVPDLTRFMSITNWEKTEYIQQQSDKNTSENNQNQMVAE